MRSAVKVFQSEPSPKEETLHPTTMLSLTTVGGRDDGDLFGTQAVMVDHSTAKESESLKWLRNRAHECPRIFAKEHRRIVE